MAAIACGRPGVFLGSCSIQYTLTQILQILPVTVHWFVRLVNMMSVAFRILPDPANEQKLWDPDVSTHTS